jgi:hypothetical protein
MDTVDERCRSFGGQGAPVKHPRTLGEGMLRFDVASLDG